ncbi:MAG: hypothetical protein R6U35_03640 [Candidatus Humimicrobiaceae bacterium]
MNSREKFNSVLGFGSITHIPKVEFGYWAATIKNWSSQGLPLSEDIPGGLLEGDLIRGSSPLGGTDGELADKNVRPFFNLDSCLAKFPFDRSRPSGR